MGGTMAEGIMVEVGMMAAGVVDMADIVAKQIKGTHFSRKQCVPFLVVNGGFILQS